MNHLRIQNELSAYLDNELTPARQKKVEAHLRVCNECSEMLTAFRQNRQMIANLAHPVPSTLKASVMAKIHAEFQDELSAYLDNELAPAMRERVETHIHACNACTEMLTAFRQNRSLIRNLEQPAPASLKTAVMAKIREQAAKKDSARSPQIGWLPNLVRWIPDFGRWFSRPVTAGATGILTLALILGALYFYPTGTQYEQTLDFYFGLHTEQLADNPLESNIGISFSTTPSEEPLSTGTVDDTELFLDLYLENVGN